MTPRKGWRKKSTLTSCMYRICRNILVLMIVTDIFSTAHFFPAFHIYLEGTGFFLFSYPTFFFIENYLSRFRYSNLCLTISLGRSNFKRLLRHAKQTTEIDGLENRRIVFFIIYCSIERKRYFTFETIFLILSRSGRSFKSFDVQTYIHR